MYYPQLWFVSCVENREGYYFLYSGQQGCSREILVGIFESDFHFKIGKTILRADTLDFPQMATIVFHIVHSHFFVDFSLKAYVYNRLVDLCTFINVFYNKELNFN